MIPTRQQGVRKITNAGTKKNIGLFPSIKMGQMIPYESLLERDFCYYAEFDRGIDKYYHQPLKLMYEYKDKERKYTADFLLEMKIGPKKLVEIKPKDKLELIDTDKIAAISNAAVVNDMVFTIITDKDLRKEPVLSNLKYLYGYAYKSLTQVSTKEILQFFMDLNKAISFKEAAEKLSVSGIGLPELYSLTFSGFLQTDLYIPLTLESLVEINYDKKGE